MRSTGMLMRSSTSGSVGSAAKPSRSATGSWRSMAATSSGVTSYGRKGSASPSTVQAGPDVRRIASSRPAR